MHNEHPPVHMVYKIICPVSPPAFRWFSKVADGLEILLIQCSDAEDQFEPCCLLLQLLAMASKECLDLLHLDIETLAPLSRILPCFGLFGQIQTLTVHTFSFFELEEDAMAWSCLRGLTSLQVCFWSFESMSMQGRLAATLQNSLNKYLL